MNISLPNTLKTFVDKQVKQRGFGTSSEYIRELIRRDKGNQQLRDLLFAGAASSPAITVDDTYFNSLRNRIKNKKG
jgi:antitoxin ParD1/3/4